MNENKEKIWPCVVVESPYNGTPDEIKRNVQYAICAMRWCLRSGFAPFASHLLYTQAPVKGFVSDDCEDVCCVGRNEAINAGLAWGAKAEKTFIFTDYGISKGMKYGIVNANNHNRPVEYISLKGVPEFERLVKSHPIPKDT